MMPAKASQQIPEMQEAHLINVAHSVKCDFDAGSDCLRLAVM